MKAIRNPTPLPRAEVAAGLVFHEGRLLITRRPAGSPLAGLWEFPGGKREPGESFEACLRRELKEELGIRVSVGPLWTVVTHCYPEVEVEIRFFFCRWVGGQPRPLGCAAFKWVDRRNLRRHRFPPADASLLAQLVQEPSLWHRGALRGDGLVTETGRSGSQSPVSRITSSGRTSKHSS